MTIIVTVLKSSEEYRAKHVRWLHSQLPKDVQSLCLSDIEVPGVDTLPLIGHWPGWWSKMEIFNPERSIIGGEDLLFLDLDTVITGDISSLLQSREFTALTDFYREQLPNAPMASAVMFIPSTIKNIVWSAWLADPDRHMRECNRPDKHGDQGFIGSIVNASRWQDVLPGAIVSYKKDIAAPGTWPRAVGNGSVPTGTKVVCFHGKPRPWDSDEPWVPPFNYSNNCYE